MYLSERVVAEVRQISGSISSTLDSVLDHMQLIGHARQLLHENTQLFTKQLLLH